MPYLGNIPATQYSELKYQDLTGGTGTGFTLDQSVGSAQDIEVFVNNVRQEPGVAYTVSGTTLTMTGSIVASDDFYVVFQGKSIPSGQIPEKQSNGDYTFDDGTLFVDASTNRVGVGTTSPADHLAVVTSGANAQLSVDRSDGATGRTVLIHSTSGGQLQTTGSAPLIFGTADTERGRFLAGGGLTFNGDTAAANALDDYEEGLFTPSFTSDGTNPTVSYSFQRGFYTKVGRTVYFQIQLGTNSVSVGSGSLFISGLPFTANASLQSRSGHIGLHYTWATSPVDTKWVLFANDNKLYLYPGDNVGNTMPTSYLDTGSSKNRIWIQGFYDV